MSDGGGGGDPAAGGSGLIGLADLDAALGGTPCGVSRTTPDFAYLGFTVGMTFRVSHTNSGARRCGRPLGTAGDSSQPPGMMAADREDARPSNRDPGSQRTEDAMTQNAPDPIVEAILNDDREGTGTIEYHREAAGQ